ncbi:MAG: hypothetical protein JSU95_04030 [Betaproteobacteria bacterium]|nr:MAG: hypothetical protein JSU95_04030 [Betaproteobacteria bacterium]
MKVTSRFLVGLIAMLAAGSASAIDTSKPFLCASMQVYECIDGRGCEAVLPEDVAAPTFMRVNVRAKEIRVLKDAPPTKIRGVARIEDRLILQGAEDGNPNRPDGVGWTLSIENDTGRFVATAAILQGAINIFGACTEY